MLAENNNDIDTSVYSIVWLARISLLEGGTSVKIREFSDQLMEIIKKHGYENPQHMGQMKIILGSALFREGKLGEALDFYGDGLAEIAAQRRGDYLVKDTLREIGEKINTLSDEDTIQWASALKEKWNVPQIAPLHPELVSFCDIRERLASTKLSAGSRK
jgi:hypothetical protein